MGLFVLGLGVCATPLTVISMRCLSRALRSTGKLMKRLIMDAKGGVMKKTALIGGILLIVGILLMAAGLVLARSDISVLNIDTPYGGIDLGGGGGAWEQTFPAGDVTLIRIEAVSGNVRIGVSANGLTHVTAEDADVEHLPGVLAVTKRPLAESRLFSIDFNFDQSEITVLVPAGIGLNVSTISGNVDFSNVDCGCVSVTIVSENISGVLAEEPEDYTRAVTTVSGGIDIEFLTTEVG